MKMYDVHSHLGKTSSGEENSAALLVEDLARYGITKVGISSLSGTVTRVQNDLVHSAMQQFPGVVMGYSDRRRTVRLLPIAGRTDQIGHLPTNAGDR